MLRGSLGQFGVDLHCDLDPGAEQITQVLRNLFDHCRGVANSTRRIERDGAIEALWLWSCGCSRRSLYGFGNRGTAIGYMLALASTRCTGTTLGGTTGGQLRRGCRICRNLRCGDLRLDKHPFERGHDLLTGLETAIVVTRGVIAIGIGKGFAFPV